MTVWAPGTRPRLFLNPAHDGEFARFAGELLESDGHVERFQLALRAAYPRAVVRPRDLSGERDLVWYVYRDGHWVAPEIVEADGEHVRRVLAGLEELVRRLLGEREAASVYALTSSYAGISRSYRTIEAGRDRCRRRPLSH